MTQQGTPIQTTTQPPPYLKLVKRVFMMKTLFKLLNPEAASSTEFNIGSAKEFKEHWDHAVNLITLLSKWDGDAFERFIDEPWMAQAFWDLQIKEDAKFRKRVYYVDFKHHPCVICLVPKLEQYNLDIRYELQTKQQTQEILADAAAIPTKGGWNKFLSGFGLRNIENVFWNIEECDPFCLLSFDPLHAYDNGGESAGQADDQIKLFPRWRNLYHFESGFMAVHFADGGKYEDLSKRTMMHMDIIC
ncbi:hypothetical protein IW261DRAFT_1420970 [Armillaria novae-zelandiae]|uniref:Uncharacterized protein n=1 Tax=Armillaria novae-zelandiae TaxID=153914 RepID=A0AA39P4P6_9AGAR|nr:hypothetical protein IW261DRAFT_1420970 [Armillaria novae-zelandiae]